MLINGADFTIPKTQHTPKVLNSTYIAYSKHGLILDLLAKIGLREPV